MTVTNAESEKGFISSTMPGACGWARLSKSNPERVRTEVIPLVMRLSRGSSGYIHEEGFYIAEEVICRLLAFERLDVRALAVGS